jgi:SAM-dependent methyltransferase
MSEPSALEGFVCPIHREPLRREEGALVGAVHGERYPIVDGVPVLIADRAERRSLADVDWSKRAAENSALSCYNREYFLREVLSEERGDMDRWLAAAEAEGPVLEIGSGKGALQGFGGDYTACDYSLTSLRAHVRPEHRRACASAERLPFADGTFRFIFTVATLEHVPGADRAFAEIERVLAPGGVAYLRPAWHCVQYNCDGIPVRPYRDLDLRQKLIKATLPVQQTIVFKAAQALPGRVVRRALWAIRPRPTAMRFGRLKPDYENYWLSDADAAARLDVHEGCLFFHSRGYEVLSPGPTALSQILARHTSVVVRKPRSASDRARHDGGSRPQPQRRASAP